MTYVYNKNIMMLNGKRLVFDHDIKTILEYKNYVVVLLEYMPNSFNDLFAIDASGKVVWNIADLVQQYRPQDEYVLIRKCQENDDWLYAHAYSGASFIIDTNTNQVIERLFVK